MSRVDLKDFLDAYLGEVGELLASANALLLAVDAPQRRREPTPRQVRELFRALHTVKGLSAMVGVEPIVGLAHRMEAVLRTADRAGGLLPEHAVDPLLEGVRAIEQRVKLLAAGRDVAEPPAALLRALDALDDAAVPSPAVPDAPMALDPALAAKLAPFERDALGRGVREGRRAICARFAPSAERAAAGTNINTVRQRLGELAEIVKVVPVSLPATPAAPAGLAFALLALTSASDVELARTTGLAAAEISTVALPTAAPELPPEPVEEPDDASGVGGGFVRVDVERLDAALEHLSALVVGRSVLAREVARLAERGVDVRGLTAILREQARQVRDLRSSILRVRMVRVSEVLDRVPLVVRALKRATGRSVRLELEAGRAELDKSVAERIFPVLIHLVRNAVDHAIEAPDLRRLLGKPEEGLVRIECRTRGNSWLELLVIDDGRGVDAAKVAARAGREVPATDAGLLQLMCRPGLTTRDEATATSGRGMGMDIVRKVVVQQLGGELALETAPGKGTTFRLRIPLTLSIVDAFTFECGAQRFVVPLATVEEIVDLETATVLHPPTPASRTALRVLERRGEAVPLVHLDEVLGLSAGRRGRALVVRREGEPLAFAVDRLLGQQEVVVRPLEDPLLAVPGIAGATDLGDGVATLVVDLVALVARAEAIG